MMDHCYSFCKTCTVVSVGGGTVFFCFMAFIFSSHLITEWLLLLLSLTISCRIVLFFFVHGARIPSVLSYVLMYVCVGVLTDHMLQLSALTLKYKWQKRKEGAAVHQGKGNGLHLAHYFPYVFTSPEYVCVIIVHFHLYIYIYILFSLSFYLCPIPLVRRKKGFVHLVLCITGETAAKVYLYCHSVCMRVQSIRTRRRIRFFFLGG
ncbi:hypothetical protein, unlikely [Trypanosoma brucei gambiense DAL972]|uniref:Uncharacterized protein n=1 Tax=Trypanosoma brucei gambiense (strain MHOM/CI/86/DAL972) TaxID=679716 RepID=C9ZLE5_TRYB9|nr:hypothetical protein, unlikely [Trypanosoma brucei gambiense DAL972]CBH10154.1 hypothetical protein, unlikely [Trypanosoma brucei gambiense DAL972]|eukprot:XP_011772444.1 hypothetical protein, unlikely [Trypanosoma brucei gambiense DAL972]